MKKDEIKNFILNEAQKMLLKELDKPVFKLSIFRRKGLELWNNLKGN